MKKHSKAVKNNHESIISGSLFQLTRHYTTKDGDKRIYRNLRCSNHVRMGNCYYNYHKMSKIELKL